MKLTYTLLTFLLFSSTFLNGQELIELEQVITYPASKNSPVQKILLPRDIPNHQKILLMEFSQEPFAVSKVDENSIAQFQIRPSDQPTKLIIRSTILKYQYDFETAVQKNKNKDHETGLTENLGDYLNHEKTIQVNSKKIQDKAKEIGGKSREEIVRNIFDFVIDRMTYTMRYRENSHAKQALATGHGNHTDYCQLMIALCRAKGIPARIVMGVAEPKNVFTKSPRHNWVEVYFKKYGWVTFDPTFADCYYERKNCPTTFDHLNSKYIDFANDRLITWDTSAAFSAQWWSNIDYTFSFKDILKENFKQAQTLYNNGNSDDALVLLDSFINMGFHQLNYHRLKTRILLRSGNYLAATQSLHLTEKKSKTSWDKEQFLFLKAMWYAYQEDFNNTYAFLNEWKNTIKYQRNIVHILKNEKAFKPMSDHPQFKKLLQMDGIDYYRSFSFFGRLATSDPIGFGFPSFSDIKNPTENVSARQHEKRYAQALAKIQNVKFIKVTDINDKLNQLFEYDKNGNQVYFFNTYGGWETQYDEANKKVSHIDFITKENKIHPVKKYFYEYEDNLVKVLFCRDNCNKEEARILYQYRLLEAGKKWKVEKFTDTGKIENWAIYTMDDQQRLIQIEGIQYDEPITIKHLYDDSGYTMTTQLILKGNTLTMAEYEFTSDGKILSQRNPTPYHKNLAINRFEYDELGRLDYNHWLIDSENGYSSTTSYTYHKDIYLKQKFTTSVNGRRIRSSTQKPVEKEFNYSYEFWR